MSEKRNDSRFLFSFLTGAAAGAVLGIFLYSEAGKNTRKKVKKWFNENGENLHKVFKVIANERKKKITED